MEQNMAIVDMTSYGLQKQYAALAQEYSGDFAVGRVLLQEKGLYRVVTESGEQLAEVSGKLRYNAKSPADFPAVGDFVLIERGSLQGNAVIHGVLPRKSAFIRKAAGTCNTEQIVAANIDTVFICMSLNNDFNIRRLERYLAVAWDSGASPVIVLTKSDLCEDIEHYVQLIEKTAIGTEIAVTSTLKDVGVEKLMSYIKKGETASFIGSSGVGKSTLINRLLGESRLATSGLRSDDKGRHTTTKRELFLLKHGGMVIDTPGMRELGLWEADSGLDKSFSDIEALAAKCRYSNCSHKNESQCAVKDAITNGELSIERLQSYQKLKAENRYNDDRTGYFSEKKQKFKNIAKINKNSNRK